MSTRPFARIRVIRGLIILSVGLRPHVVLDISLACAVRPALSNGIERFPAGVGRLHFVVQGGKAARGFGNFGTGLLVEPGLCKSLLQFDLFGFEPLDESGQVFELALLGIVEPSGPLAGSARWRVARDGWRCCG